MKAKVSERKSWTRNVRRLVSNVMRVIRGETGLILTFHLVNYIHKYFIDPKTSTPHPVVRLELALEEAKIRIDPEQCAERQAHDAVKKLTSIIPLKKCEMEAKLSVGHGSAGAVTGILHKFASIRGEKWSAGGCEWDLSIVPGGKWNGSGKRCCAFVLIWASLVCLCVADYDQFFSELNRATKGDFEFNIAGQSAPSTPSGGDGHGKKGGKKGKKGRK